MNDEHEIVKCTEDFINAFDKLNQKQDLKLSTREKMMVALNIVANQRGWQNAPVIVYSEGD